MIKRLVTNKQVVQLLLLVVAFQFCANTSMAQPVLPQRTLTVTATQPLYFGTVYLIGSVGGSVTIGWDGSRSSTGSVGLSSLAPFAQPAIFEIKLCQGRNVDIEFDASTTLTGDNGGSLTVDIGPTEKGINGARFTTNSDCNFITPLRVGGKLYIPGSVIPGNYTGTFAVTFNQE